MKKALPNTNNYLTLSTEYDDSKAEHYKFKEKIVLFVQVINHQVHKINCGNSQSPNYVAFKEAWAS